MLLYGLKGNQYMYESYMSTVWHWYLHLIPEPSLHTVVSLWCPSWCLAPFQGENRVLKIHVHSWLLSPSTSGVKLRHTLQDQQTSQWLNWTCYPDTAHLMNSFSCCVMTATTQNMQQQCPRLLLVCVYRSGTAHHPHCPDSLLHSPTLTNETL